MLRLIREGASTCAGALALAAFPQVTPPTAPPQVEKRPSLEWSCDVATLRAAGLVAAGLTDEEAWRALETFARWHLAVTGLEVEVAREPGASALKLAARSDARLEAAQRALAWGLSVCRFYLVAEDRDVAGGLDEERKRFDAWLEKNPTRPWLEYNADPGRGQRGIAWFPTRFAEKTGPPLALLVPTTASQAFSGVDFAEVYVSTDRLGYPAVGFELTRERVEDFADFTGQNIHRRLAIVLNGEVRSCPTLEAKLRGSAIIEGRFSDEEVKSLIDVLRKGGALRVRAPPVSTVLVLKVVATAVALLVAGIVLWRSLRKRPPRDWRGSASA